MKTLVKSRICKYWETCELPLYEDTIWEINGLIAAYTNRTAPIVTEEDIVQCYMGEEVAEHLKAKYEYGYDRIQVSLCDIVNDVLDQFINAQEIEFSLMDVDYQENSVEDSVED
jgi:hypothetical protein